MYKSFKSQLSSTKMELVCCWVVTLSLWWDMISPLLNIGFYSYLLSGAKYGLKNLPRSLEMYGCKCKVCRNPAYLISHELIHISECAQESASVLRL